MCQKIIYSYQKLLYHVACTDFKARLPVLKRNGESILVHWGRHKHDPSQLAISHCISLREIYDGKWDAFFPKPVKLPIKSFLVQDIHNDLQWFHLPSGKWIQGLLARFDRDSRVYIVTLPPSESGLYPLWPRILLGE